MSIANKQKGQALLLVLTILGVVSVVGFTFLYMVRVQIRGANSYLARLQSRYLAEAGINHAKEILEFDKTEVALDSYDDIWRTAFAGTDVDLDNDGLPDSKWFYVQDDEDNDVGRYAVLVSDEAGKININSAGLYNDVGLTQGYSTFEVSLANLFDNFSISEIFDYRYGTDNKPGVANVDDNNNNYSLENDSLDNDADGIVDEANEGVDEPQEFNIDAPAGDDRPFVVIEELKNLNSISSDQLEEIRQFITVSSKDQEVAGDGSLRQNINFIKADNLIKIMLSRGIGDCWQKAANIVDSLDTNSARTTVFKHYNLIESSGAQTTGDWVWVNNRHECSIPAGQGTWTWSNLSFGDGEYYCFIYGNDDNAIGDVTIGGDLQEGMDNADAFVVGENNKVAIKNGSLSISIQNNEGFGQTCYFSRIELIPEDRGTSQALSQKEINGVEAVRINELMIRPKVEIYATAASSPGGLWSWQNGVYVNSSPDSGQEGEGTWTFDGIPNGNYYMRLIGQGGQFIGDVDYSGRTQESMRHADSYTAFNTVGVTNNKLILRIQNNFSDKNCYFKGIVLSQQPDAEYLELINISNSAIDLGGWILETTGQESATTFIPQGTTIGPYGYLVLCVDRSDEAQGISGNGISFSGTWGNQTAVQLDFFRVLDRDFDFLNDTPVAGENFLILKDANAKVVDKVEYLQNQISDYYALERDDPTSQEDSNGNSEFDGWYKTMDLSGGTPGRGNDNIGMQKDEFSNHDISEVSVRNSPVSNILNLTSVPSGSSWQNFASLDISLIVDALVVYGIALYPKGNNVSGWNQIFAGSEAYYSSTLGEEGIWQWQKLNNGNYFLTIKGETDEAVTVSYKKADDSWQLLAQEVIPNEEGLAYGGIIDIGGDDPMSTADNTLEIKLSNASNSTTAHFYYLRLDPFASVYGRININTAPKEVLSSLPYVNSLEADMIINDRPFGNKNGVYKGIGDLFLSNIFTNDPERASKLGTLSNLITVRSHVFEIISRAQVLEQEKVIATQEIKTIIERQ